MRMMAGWCDREERWMKRDARCCITPVATSLALLVVAGCGAKQIERTDLRFYRLVSAISEGRLADVRRAIRAGADVNGRDSEGWTPLHWTASLGVDRPQIARELISAGADVDAATPQGDAPIRFTMNARGHLGVATALLEAGEDPNRTLPDGRPLVFEAARWDQADMVALLAERGADLCARDSQGNTALHRSAWASRKLVDVFLEHGIDLDARNNDSVTPLHYAAAESFNVQLKSLCQTGADVNARIAKDVDFVFGVGKASSGAGPLHLVAENCNVEGVRLLLDAGADINLANDSGSTPIIYAIAGDTQQPFLKGYEETVRELIARGADLSPGSKSGDLALFLADRGDLPDTVEQLVRRTAERQRE